MASNPAPEKDLQQVAVTFNGKPLNCRPGTSLAVALWENGVRHLSHSHKYGRPRGVTCARGHCTNCLLRVDGVPNVRSCETTVRAGMAIATQDTGTFYGGPMQKLLFFGSAWVPVGFYYKWFTRPATLSRFFLDRIRPMTGVGRLPDAGHDRRLLPAVAEGAEAPAARDAEHFQTVVIGAGPSGLEAARNAAGPVLLLDDGAELGGQRYQALRELNDKAQTPLARFPVLEDALRRIDTALADLPESVRDNFRGRTKAVAAYHPNRLVLRRAEDVQTVVFDNLVWAAGALDTIGLFPGNDTPGIFGPRALYRLLTRDGMIVAGCHVLLVGAGLDLWLSAALLAARGATISLVVTEGGCQAEVAAAVDLKWALNTGLVLEEIRAAGAGALQAVFRPRRNSPGPRGSHMHLEADFAVLCQPGKPAYDIPFQLGAPVRLRPERGGYLPRDLEPATDTELRVTLPGGVQVMYTGETLGQAPREQVEP